MIKLIVFTLLVIIAFITFFYFILQKFKALKIAEKENRFDNFLKRLRNVFYYGFIQSKIFRFKFSGVLHFIIFFGFLILLISIIENIIEVYIPNFFFNFLGIFYSYRSFLQDIFGIFVLLSAQILLFRRFIFTPTRLKNNNKFEKLDASLILTLIILIIISMFGMNAQKILMDSSSSFRPVTKYISSFIIDNSSNNNIYELFWWTHIILILLFLNYIPFSKHFHIITSIPNIYFSNRNIFSNYIFEPINFENSNKEYFGTRDVTDLKWKQLFDSFTCTHCGRCSISCPANQSGKLHDPKKIILEIRKRTIDISKQGNSIKKNFINDYITKEEIWDCTTCLACMQECPVLIEHLISLINFRRYLVLSESDFPKELNAIFRNLENYYSPYAIMQEDRNNWIYEFLSEIEGNCNLIKLSDGNKQENFDVLFWVGCFGAIDTRNIKVTKSFAKILNYANIKFAVLGKEEKCNGDLARSLGNEYLAQELIRANINTFNKYKVKKVVTICPHCYNTFKNEYSQFGIELEVYHHTQYIYNLLKTKRINIIKDKKISLSYHDPCYLGRYNSIYNEPRNILKMNFMLKEIKRTKSKSLCCGAGGGRMFIEETKGKRISELRLNNFLEKNLNYIITSCPFCLSMLSDSSKTKNEIKIKDISELLIEHIKIN